MSNPASPTPSAPVAPFQPDPRSQWRDFLDQMDSCALALEGLLELATPYTAEEGARATVLRASVGWALTPAVLAMRQAVDAGWTLYQGGTP